MCSLLARRRAGWQPTAAADQALSSTELEDIVSSGVCHSQGVTLLQLPQAAVKQALSGAEWVMLHQQRSCAALVGHTSVCWPVIYH
jgi:hypothetical protein